MIDRLSIVTFLHFIAAVRNAKLTEASKGKQQNEERQTNLLSTANTVCLFNVAKQTNLLSTANTVCLFNVGKQNDMPTLYALI